MKPVYTKTADTRLAGLERQVRFLLRRSQTPEPDSYGAGGGGIQFDTDPQTGGFLVVTTTASGGVSVHADNGGVDLSSDDFVDLTSTGDGGIWLHTEGAGNLFLEANAGSDVVIQIHSPALLQLVGLPTSDPGVGNAVWRDSSGFLRIH
jgi:hypothetical protein